MMAPKVVTWHASAIANDGFLRDKIALITRGDCSFSEKVHNAENAGALGVIVCKQST